MDERKLLIADDSELNRAILVSVLEKNFDILEAADGKRPLPRSRHTRAISPRCCWML